MVNRTAPSTALPSRPHRPGAMPLRQACLTVFVCFAALACSEPPAQPAADPDPAVVRDVSQGAPTETVGVASTVRGAVPLAAYADALGNGALRLREMVLEPGAQIALHSHETRPAVVYVLEGEVVEHRSDFAEPAIRRAGDVYLEGHGVVHWLENTSPNRVRAVSVDILPPDPGD